MKLSKIGATPCHVKCIVSLHLLIGLMAMIAGGVAEYQAEYQGYYYIALLPYVHVWAPLFIFATSISGGLYLWYDRQLKAYKIMSTLSIGVSIFVAVEFQFHLNTLRIVFLIIMVFNTLTAIAAICTIKQDRSPTPPDNENKLFVINHNHQSVVGTTPGGVKCIVSLHLLVALIAMVIFVFTMGYGSDIIHDACFTVIWAPLFICATSILSILQVEYSFNRYHQDPNITKITDLTDPDNDTDRGVFTNHWNLTDRGDLMERKRMVVVEV